MKKLILLIMSVLCVVNVKALANSIGIDAETDDKITVTVSTDFEDSAASFEFVYDKSCMEFESSVFSDNISSSMPMINPAYTENSVKVSLLSATNVPGGDICTMTFKKNNDADKNVKLTIKNATFADGEGNEIAFEIREKELIFKKQSSSSRGGGYLNPITPVTKEEDAKPGIKEQIILTIGKVEAIVFGETKTNDVAPVIRKDRTMLPARFVAENLGAVVLWDSDLRRVTLTKDDITVIITIDSSAATVNGENVTLDSPAFIEDDRTYTPLRFIAEALGADVQWNEEKSEVIITKKSTEAK